MDDIALEPHIDLGALALFLFRRFLDAQDHRNIDDLVEVADHAIQLVFNVFAQGLADIHMVSGDHQVHTVGSNWQGTKGDRRGIAVRLAFGCRRFPG
ncbi:hypothetical protein AYR66_11365 [Noviherbaspirillum denitrificans]|uniref:Uncharacterized protein n=1 Tax=Noviherbaspirillum denitrificans TaxID=1968433 RepID=A0A254TBT0_9BURK|nr:hypothetical protein AYR66_11365 [Noviherbaspirillum denitrificans]